MDCKSSTNNEAEPITPYSETLEPDIGFVQFGWDNHNHLYALGYYGENGPALYVRHRT
jgi:hypothetical protein